VRRALFALKVVVTVAVLGVVLAAADLPALGRLLSHASPAHFAAAVAVLLAQTLVLAVRFRSIVAALGQPISARFAIELTFVGALFNQALPSAVGGDAIRAWQLRGDGRSWREALTSVLLDRSSGVVVLAVLAAAAVALEPSGVFAHLRAPLWSVAAAGVAAIVALAGAERLELLPRRARDFIAASGLPAGTRILLSTRLGGMAAAWSAASHLLAALACYLLAGALGIDLPLGVFLAAALCMLLATMIPLSYAGWGVREVGAIWLFAQLGLTAEQALAISMLFGASLLVAALPGVTFWLAPHTAASARRIS